MTAGSVTRFGEEESRRAPDGGTAENAGVTWERVDAEDGGLRACPSVDRSATPRLLELAVLELAKLELAVLELNVEEAPSG